MRVLKCHGHMKIIRYQRKQARKVQDAQAEKLTRVAIMCLPAGANLLVKPPKKNVATMTILLIVLSTGYFQLRARENVKFSTGEI